MIPARMNSKRFPGKAIAKICGKPMIWWVYNQAKKVKCFDAIYVVTSDLEIKNECENYYIPCVCNNTNETTAAQKIALEAGNIVGDIYINIQGDEPLINPNAIQQLIDAMISDEDLKYVGLKSEIDTVEEFNDINVVKVVTDKDGYALYFSRSPIPYTYKKGNSFRVLGIYGYRKEVLDIFRIMPKSNLEDLEKGIEMLRIMENGEKIKLLETNYHTIGVDLPEHVDLVEKIIKEGK